ncbi:hypothetical protein E3U55_04550 [Filobacillus milosensis]|uniref:Uncharacterized protein n=1 Tax=Filobacillus milosensis TaxID=94137 RepID=A0A4Y8IR76_9BACI|nr:hypothetical protein [Filobacillus milosensis]TFB24088.1 hypothetical protein E3U55_04550 [Filobacillus milosensis]
MSKNFQSLSIIILGLCILGGSWFISQSLIPNQEIEIKTQQEEQFRYEFLSPNENNIIIFDKQTGDYWRKFIASNEGPSNWEKQDTPVSTISE